MNCVKVPHKPGVGYLHDESDDSPYDVDGVKYCGRCHYWIDVSGVCSRPAGDYHRLMARIEVLETASRENLISARIIQAENDRHSRSYEINRDCKFIIERTEAALKGTP